MLRLAVGVLVLAGVVHARQSHTPYCLDFTDAASVVRLPGCMPKRAPFGIGVWIRHGVPVSRPVHLVSGERTSGQEKGAFFLGFENAARIRFGVRDADGRVFSVGGRIPRADGAWHHVAASFDGTTLAIWLDGKELERRELEGFKALVGRDAPLVVGPVSTNDSKRRPVFPGQIANLRVFSRARAAAEIREFRERPDEANRAGLDLEISLRAGSPTNRVHDATGREYAIDDALARAAWCVPETLPEDLRVTPRGSKKRRSTDLHCVDLGEIPDSARAILVVRGKKREQPGVLWQARNGRVHLTWAGFDGRPPKTEVVEGEGVLVAGTTDENGTCYTMRIVPKPRERHESDAVVARMHRHASTLEGAKVKLRGPSTLELDTTRGGFNLWSYGGRWHGNMVYHNGTLGLVIPRTMYRSGDGLRHQSAIAVTFSTKTLAVARMLGTTSSHSMGNVLTLGAKGDFLALDLGDNYPRGLHLHRITPTSKSSQVVFTYKTAHATRPRNGSPRYDEISKDGKTFYKWSNDNATYSELGTVIERKSHYTVIFSTDRSREGRVLDNSRAYRGCDDPRDLALLRVRKALGKGRGSVVSDAVMASLPKGSKPEEGGFFDFSGRWSPQRVPGVYWLTNYNPGEAAHAPQACARADGSILVVWEKSGDELGGSLQLMEIDKRGKFGSVRTLPVYLRFRREERMMRIGDRLCVLASDPRDGHTRLYFFRDGS